MHIGGESGRERFSFLFPFLGLVTVVFQHVTTIDSI